MMQVREGDASAFEELVGRYQTRLMMVLSHLVGSREQAEDLAQDVFLRIYRARANYVPGAKFSTWLFTIANNVASNARRTKARRREVNLVTAGSGSFITNPLEHMAKEKSGQMPTRQLDKAEVSQMVRIAMESLNERQRMAVLLSKFEGMSYAEIAETMELSTQATKSLLSRARENLRMILMPYLKEGQLPPSGE